MKSIDPQQAQTLDPTKTQRLIRSLEIIELTGERVSELQRRAHRAPRFSFCVIGLALPRPVLYARINARVLEMMRKGLLEEARWLYEKFGRQHQQEKINALETVGYKELFEMFEGKHSLEEAIAQIQQHTRNYAKRQITFFRNKLSVHWIAAPEREQDIAFALQRVISIFPQPVFQ
ncbi:MAG: tRNA dimethylallyltransferase [Chloroherpetonaceae bacterium]|nr:tRNA dimethylallyltransferase [Chloroherpetonaceae bacterium]